LVASLSIGIVFSLIGFYGLIELFLAPRGLRYEMGMVFFGVVGGSIIFDSLKKRYFLEVHKSNDVCRLVFSKKAQLNDIQNFCNKVRTTYQFKIEENI
jgi:hypothetical protein